MNSRTDRSVMDGLGGLVAVGAVIAALHFGLMIILLGQGTVPLFWVSLLVGLGCALIIVAKRAIRRRAREQVNTAAR